ncbi:MAG: hypothetical protein HF973_09765 [Chloroflexi bacterium]|nr:hypothetical protein [Chloroflexota bacterium]
MFELNKRVAFMLFAAVMFAAFFVMTTTYSAQAGCGYYTTVTSYSLGDRCGSWDFWCALDPNEWRWKKETGRHYDEYWYDENWVLCYEDHWDTWTKIGCCRQ